jgi:hypothetical protein
MNERLKILLKNSEIRRILTQVNESNNRLGALRSVLALDPKNESLISECFDLMLESTGFLDREGVSSL